MHKAVARLRQEVAIWKMRRSLRHVDEVVVLWVALAIDEEEDDDAEADVEY